MPGHLHIVLIEHNIPRIGTARGEYAPVFEAVRVHRPDPAPAEMPPARPQEVPPPPPPGEMPDPQPSPMPPPSQPERPVDAGFAGGSVLVLTRRWS